jgi:hypothetical protein
VSVVSFLKVRVLSRPGLKSRATYGRPCPGLPRNTVVDSLTTSVDVPNIQFEATIWSDVGSLCDD